MLVVVMHNNQEYLETLIQLAKVEGIKDTAIVDQNKIGMRLIGGTSNVTISKGSSLNAYNKAFVAMLKGEEKINNFLEMIDKSNELNMLNLDDKGFVCALPFKNIKDFQKEILN